jgi:hypothetical protein
MIRIKLMPDYGCWPLWITGPEADNIDPRSLPLSPETINKLESWSGMYDETLDQNYPPDSRFKTEEERRRFNLLGRELLQSLERELGNDYAVTYQNHWDDEACP